MNILITGGLGYIGRSCIPRLLGRGVDRIRVIDNLEPSVHGPAPDLDAYTRDWGTRVDVTLGSVTNRDLLSDTMEDMDGILHLAALTSVPDSMRNAAHHTDVGINGTAHLVDLLAKHPQVKQIVLVSSRAVYGEGPHRCPKGCPDTEFTPLQRSQTELEAGRWDPQCPGCGSRLEPLAAPEAIPLYPSSVYGITKLMQEQLLERCAPVHDTAVTAFRLQNLYGPGQSRAVPDVGVANIFAQRILAGDTLNLFEDGEPLRDFVYIDDVVELLVDTLTRTPQDATFKVYNVGSGEGFTLREMAEMLFEAAGLAPRLRVTGEYRLGDVRHCVSDVNRLTRDYGWSPTSLRTGLTRLLEWIRRESTGMQTSSRG